MKKIIISSLICCSILSVALPTTIANASEIDVLSNNTEVIDITKPENSFVENYIQENNISLEKAEILRYKSENGIAWDVYDDEKFNAIPEYYKSISLDELEQIITSKRYDMEDGSVFSIKMSPDSNAIKTRAVTNYSQGSQYNQEQFTMSRGALVARVVVSGWLARVGYGYSNITEIYGGAVSGFGTNGNASERLVRSNESSGKAALVEVKWATNGSVGGSWGPFSGSIPAGSTCFMYVAFIRGQVKVASSVPL